MYIVYVVLIAIQLGQRTEKGKTDSRGSFPFCPIFLRLPEVNVGPFEIVYKVDISRSIESFNLADFSKGTAYKSQYRMQETLNAFWGNTNAPTEPLISSIIAHTTWTNRVPFSASFGLSSLPKS